MARKLILLQVFFKLLQINLEEQMFFTHFIFDLDTELKVRSCSLLYNIRVCVCARARACMQFRKAKRMKRH